MNRSGVSKIVFVAILACIALAALLFVGYSYMNGTSVQQPVSGSEENLEETVGSGTESVSGNGESSSTDGTTEETSTGEGSSSGGGGGGGGGESGNDGGSTGGEKKAPNYCTDESREVEECDNTQHLVCGWYSESYDQCESEPCVKLFVNECKACLNPNIEYYVEGECPLYE